MNIKRASDPHKFFSKTEKKKIVKAIQTAEKETSGEIRMHLEKHSSKPVFARAVEVFNKIGMGRTALKNGVLIYLASSDQQFVILGDKGINAMVPENFWNDVITLMSQRFKEGQFCEGVCEGIAIIGEKLKTFFPFNTDDRNELSNEISILDE